MRTGRLVILAALVLALGAFIALWERHQPTTEEATKSADKVFGALDRAEVKAVEVHNPHGDFRLAKQGDDWQLTAPVAYPADQATVGSLLSAVLDLKVDRRLAVGEVKDADYGLDKPPMSVVLETTDGARHLLAVGTEAALGGDRAVRRDSGAILMVPGWFTSDLDKDLDAWRSHDLVDVAADQLASIQVATPEDRLHLVREDRQWRMMEPLSDLADRDQVRDLVSDLNAVKVDEFLPADAALGPLGLEHPRYRITLVRTSGKEPVELEMGATRQEKDATQVACRRDGRDLFWVSDRAETRLAKAPVLWRAHTAYPFDTWDAEGLTVKAGGTDVAVERAEGTWTLAGGGEAAQGAVSARLADLSRLAVTAFDLAVPAGEPAGRITLKLAGEAAGGDNKTAAGQTVEYAFWEPMAEGDKAVLTVSGRPGAMAADAAAVKALLADPAALRTPPATPTPEPAAAPAPSPSAVAGAG